MATATKLAGLGYAPGYGKVTAPAKKKTGLYQGPNSIRNSAALALTQYKPTGGGTAASATGTGTPAVGPQVLDVNALPPDPVYDAQIGGLTRTRDDTLAALAGSRTQALSDYGYDATYDTDAQGNVAGVKSLAIAPNNPYSRAAQLQKSYDDAKRGTTTSMAARGQLYSGALVNAQNANDNTYNTSRDTMEKNLGAILAGLIGQERSARTAFETGRGTAFGDRVGRAQSPGTAPSSGGSPAAPTTYSSVIDNPPAGASQADKIKLLQQYGAVNSYTNAQGHKVRTFADGHKEVFVNGRWQRV